MYDTFFFTYLTVICNLRHFERFIYTIACYPAIPAATQQPHSSHTADTPADTPAATQRTHQQPHSSHTSSHTAATPGGTQQPHSGHTSGHTSSHTSRHTPGHISGRTGPRGGHVLCSEAPGFQRDSGRNPLFHSQIIRLLSDSEGNTKKGNRILSDCLYKLFYVIS